MDETISLEEVMKRRKERELREKILDEKIVGLIDGMMKKHLGVRIDELSKDLSDKLTKKQLFQFDIDVSLSFKKAKKQFKRKYLLYLLQKNYGNVSEVAKIANVNRRSIHRLLKGSTIKNIRKEMVKPTYVKKQQINTAIEDALTQYREIIHPKKFKAIYRYVPKLTENLVTELPEQPLTLQEAEEEFEKEYLTKVLEQHNFNVKETAKAIKLRAETLHRKIKRLRITP